MEISESEGCKTVRKNTKPNADCLKNINEIDKTLAKVMKKNMINHKSLKSGIKERLSH